MTNVPVAEAASKPVQDRFLSGAVDPATSPVAVKSTKTAEAVVPTGAAVPSPAK
jgi:hypothetical protein